MGAFLTGMDVMIADGVLIACAFSLVLTRLWFRIFYQRLSLTLSDVFLLIASAEVLAIILIFAQEYKMGVMTETVPEMTPEVRKYSFATVLLYDTSLYFLKFSILAFYFKLFPASSSKLRNALLIVTIYTVACSMAALFMALFWCGLDVSVYWRAIKPGPKQCSFWSHGLFTADWILNITSDVLILLLPFPLLARLRLARRQVVALCFTFGLGLATMIVSIGRFVTFVHTAFVPLYVWSMAEICTGIIVVSLPALRPLLRRASHVVHPSPPDSHAMSRGWMHGRNQPSGAAASQRNYASRAGGASRSKSKTEIRAATAEPPEGYQYTYETETISSDVELHGGLMKSDIESQTEEINVYTDAKEVINQHSPNRSSRPEAALTRDSNAKAWVQKTRQYP